MPRVGSREWNRQENLRRQREAEQVVQATPVNPIFNITNEFVVEAQPLECRRDILQLREQIQNKITQINQLKTNTKEFKKQIKEYKKKHEGFKRIFDDLSRCGYMNHDDKKIDFDYQLNMIACDIKSINTDEKKNFEEWKKKQKTPQKADVASYALKAILCDNKKTTQNYIRYLECLISSNGSLLDQIAKGFNFENYYKKYNCDISKFRKAVANDVGNDFDVNEYPICVLCEEMCDCKYGHNPEPLKDNGRCCDKCNQTKVIPARIRNSILEEELIDSMGGRTFNLWDSDSD